MGFSSYDKTENCKIPGQKEEPGTPGEAGQRLLFLSYILPSVTLVTVPWLMGPQILPPYPLPEDLDHSAGLGLE